MGTRLLLGTVDLALTVTPAARQTGETLINKTASDPEHLMHELKIKLMKININPPMPILYMIVLNNMY